MNIMHLYVNLSVLNQEKCYLHKNVVQFFQELMQGYFLRLIPKTNHCWKKYVPGCRKPLYQANLKLYFSDKSKGNDKQNIHHEKVTKSNLK